MHSPRRHALLSGEIRKSTWIGNAISGAVLSLISQTSDAKTPASPPLASLQQSYAVLQDSLLAPFCGEIIPTKGADIDNLREFMDAIRRNRYGHTKRTMDALVYGQEIEEIVMRILDEEKVPRDIFYVMLAESAAIPVSISGAGASGYWQFMEPTARHYGLKTAKATNGLVDERFHLTKSTRAAARHFRDLYATAGSWYGALVLYNMGEPNYKQEAEAQKENFVWDEHLNDETSKYGPNVRAMKYIYLNRSLLYSGPEAFFLATGGKMQTTELHVTGPIHSLIRWAHQQGVSYDDLRELNPWIRSKALPAGSWTILLPAEKRKEAYIDSLSTPDPLPQAASKKPSEKKKRKKK